MTSAPPSVASTIATRARRRRARRRATRRHDPGVEAERAAPFELVGVRAVPTTLRAERLRELQRRRCRRRDRPRARAPTRPAATCARVTSASCAVTNASGTPPIATRSRPSGTGAHCAAGTATYSACAPPPTMPNTAVAELRSPVTLGADRLDDARELEPGDVGRRSRAARGSGRRAGGDRRGSARRRAPGRRPRRRPAPGRVGRRPRAGRRRSVAARIGAGRLTAPGTGRTVDAVTAWARGSSTTTGRGRLDAREADACSPLTGASTRRRCRRAPTAGRACSPRSRSSTCSTPARRTRAPASSSTSPTTRRRCTSTSSTSRPTAGTARWRDPLVDEWLDVVDVRRAARPAADAPSGEREVVERGARCRA